MLNQITLLVTACGRPDLLMRTLDSLDKYYRLSHFAAVWVNEDGIGTDNSAISAAFPCVRWVNSRPGRGHMASLTSLYANVTTPWIFHCEDDWEFYDWSFMEKSIMRLEKEKQCLQVWLRAHNDTNGHSIEYKNGYRMSLNDSPKFHNSQNRHKVWRGFSLNPGLRRAKEFANFDFTAASDGLTGWRAEQQIGEYFYRRGYFAAILDNPAGYVRHIGENRHIEDQA